MNIKKVFDWIFLIIAIAVLPVVFSMVEHWYQALIVIPFLFLFISIPDIIVWVLRWTRKK